MWSAASMMSLRYNSSRRIDEPRVREHRGSNARLEPVLRDEVDLPAEEPLKIQHQSSVLDEADIGVRLKLNQQIDIAIGAHFPTGGGTEH